MNGYNKHDGLVDIDFLKRFSAKYSDLREPTQLDVAAIYS